MSWYSANLGARPALSVIFHDRLHGRGHPELRSVASSPLWVSYLYGEGGLAFFDEPDAGLARTAVRVRHPRWLSWVVIFFQHAYRIILRL